MFIHLLRDYITIKRTASSLSEIQYMPRHSIGHLSDFGDLISLEYLHHPGTIRTPVQSHHVLSQCGREIPD